MIRRGQQEERDMTEGERPAELLDGDAARAYITGHLEQMTEKDMCAVFMIDLDHTVEIVGMLGQKTVSYSRQKKFYPCCSRLPTLSAG